MNPESEFGYKVRQALNLGSEGLGLNTAKRLQAARQVALERQRFPVRGLQLAGVGQSITDAMLNHGRILVASLALFIGASGSYVWNLYDQADEYAELDSALLADDLPPAAYLDHGFRAWLDRPSQSPQ